MPDWVLNQRPAPPRRSVTHSNWLDTDCKKVLSSSYTVTVGVSVDLAQLSVSEVHD